jgi:hypothetical protein
MKSKEAELEAQAWLAEHAVLLGPEELPFEEERLAEALVLRDGCWPSPRPVEHIGQFAEIVDEESFNRIIGDPCNWQVILDRSDLYHSWVLPQAAIIFGRAWFERVQWKNSIRRGVPFALFAADERRMAKENGIPLAETTAGRSIVYKIVSRIEHALDVYLAGGGRSKIDDRIKRPGGYIVESIANEFIQDAGADKGFRLLRVRACPNCLATKRGRARRSQVRHLLGNTYQCERCADTVRNLDLVIEKHRANGTPVPREIALEYGRVSCFQEFTAVTCVCPNVACRGRFVPLDCVEDPQWWSTPEGLLARKAVLQLRALKGVQRFQEPPSPLLGLPLRCPICEERFTPAVAMAAASGFRGQSGKLTGLPSMFVWVKREARIIDHGQAKSHTSINDMLVDSSCVDPTQRITAEQHVRILVGELALHARELSEQTAPAIISRCFCEAVSEWMLKHPEDASRYFLEWSAGEKDDKRTTRVAKGREAAIHQTILYAWLARISGHIDKIRRARGSKIRALEDLKWFCRPPAYSGGPRSSFVATVDDGLRVRNASRVVPVGDVADRPRMAWVLSVRKIGPDGRPGPELASYMRSCEWQIIAMSRESGLIPGDQVKIVALMMPGHHCHAPIQRIIRLRTSLLSGIIERIRCEESLGETDMVFWRDWQKRAEAARNATGIGV